METITTKPIPTGEGLTFEKVWAALMETKERQEEAARQMRETDRIIQETSLQIKENDRKLTEKISKLTEQMGGLHNSFGSLAEHLVAPSIVDLFNDLGYHFDAVYTRGLKILDDDNKKLKTEIDILLENSEFILAVEVKTDLKKEKDVNHHSRRLEILREHFDKKQYKPKKILGAIALAMPEIGDREEITGAGFYMLEQSGDTIKMNVPEGFTPKEW